MSDHTDTIDTDIAALSALLETEIEEIRGGTLDRVAARLEEKAALVARIEGQGPEIAVRLEAEDSDAEMLRDALDRLAGLVARDAAILERMRLITAEVSRDLERLRARHGLAGLYGADGNRSAKDTLSRSPMDKSV
ncbi:hypothetical protein ACR03S_06175 [Limimaricola variabilis]